MNPATTRHRSSRSEFLAGARLAVPVIVASAPFAVLYGALAVSNGLSVFEATLMSAAIYGGASQMVGIELFGQKIAPWLIIFSIFAVNFRHVLYSAAVGRRIADWSFIRKTIAFFFLVDPQFAETERKAERGEGFSFAWYMGFAVPNYSFWVIESGLGAAFSSFLPDTRALGLDFLLPIYFLGLVMGFRARSFWFPVVAVSAVASIVAYKLVGSPWHVSIGAVAGVALAASMPTKRREEW